MNIISPAHLLKNTAVFLGTAVLSSALFAGTIEVNTFEEGDANDGLCSLREAVNLSGAKRISNEQQDNIDQAASALQRKEIEIIQKLTSLTGVSYDSADFICANIFSLSDNPNTQSNILYLCGDENNSVAGDPTLEGQKKQLRLEEITLQDLQAAVDNSDCEGAEARGDIIALEIGTYTLANTPVVTSSDLTIQPNFSLENTDVDSRVTITGDNSFQLFDMSSGKSLSFIQTILTQGNATKTVTADSLGKGGAVYCKGNLTFKNSELADNTAVNGGAIYATNSCQLSIEKTRFERNSASENGGALYTFVNAAAVSTEWYENTAGIDGGAIFIVSGEHIFDKARIGKPNRANTAGRNGGGIAVLAEQHSSLELQRSSIIDNEAGENGGGVSLLPKTPNTLTYTLAYTGSGTSTTTITIFDETGTTELSSTQSVTGSNGETSTLTEIVYEAPEEFIVYQPNLTSSVTVTGTVTITKAEAYMDDSFGTDTITISYINVQETHISRTVTWEKTTPNANEVVSLVMANTTIAQNKAAQLGGGLYGDSRGRRLLNNVTLVENEAVTGGGLHLARLFNYQEMIRNNEREVATGLLITNSVIAYNSATNNADCLFTQENNTPENAAYQFMHSFRNLISDANQCTDPNDADLSFNQIAPAAITDVFIPVGAGTYNDLFGGYSPLVGGLAHDHGAESNSDYPCQSIDMRVYQSGFGENAIPRYQNDFNCDIGSVEYQKGIANSDEYKAIDNTQPICLDVLRNDVNDEKFDRDRGDSFTFLNDALTITTDQGGTAKIVEFCDADGDGINDFDLQDLDKDGDIGDADIDALGILYTPPNTLNGQDTFEYQIRINDVESFTQALMNTAPPQDNFADYSCGAIFNRYCGGSFTAPTHLFLILLGLFGWFKRYNCQSARQQRQKQRSFTATSVLTATVSLAGLLLLSTASSPVHAQDIYVNSCNDQVPDNNGELTASFLNDGACTLREAIRAADHGDSTFNLSKDCPNGDNGVDNIILQMPAESSARYNQCAEISTRTMTINLQAPIISHSIVDIKCEGWDNNPAEGGDAELTADDYCIIQRPAGAVTADNKPFRLFETFGHKFTLRSLILQGGESEDGNGGAILANSHIEAYNVIFRNNKARSGGAIYLIEVRKSLVTNGALFDNNHATQGSGGAVSMSTNQEHEININATTFQNNSATQLNSPSYGGALNIASSAEVLISNSTFTENSADYGAAIDLRNSNGRNTINSTTIIGNTAAEESGAIHTNPIGEQASVQASIIANNTPENCNSDRNSITDSLIDDNSCQANHTVTTSITDLLEYQTTLKWPVFVPTNTNESNDLIIDILDSAECSSSDQLGTSRENGGKCDLGAVERKAITALSDEQSNQGYNNPLSCRNLANEISNTDVRSYSVEGIVLVDILGNDLPDPVYGIDTFSTTFADLAPGASATIFKKENIPNDFLTQRYETQLYAEQYATELSTCIEDRRNLLPDYVLIYQGDPVSKDTFSYTIISQGDANSITSASATVTVTLNNAEPIAVNDTIQIDVSSPSVIFSVHDNDIDPEKNTIGIPFSEDADGNDTGCPEGNRLSEDGATLEIKLGEPVEYSLTEFNALNPQPSARNVTLNTSTITITSTVTTTQTNADGSTTSVTSVIDTETVTVTLTVQEWREKLAIVSQPDIGRVEILPETCQFKYYGHSSVDNVSFNIFDTQFSYKIWDNDAIEFSRESSVGTVYIDKTGPGAEGNTDSLCSLVKDCGGSIPYHYLTLLFLLLLVRPYGLLFIHRESQELN